MSMSKDSQPAFTPAPLSLIKSPLLTDQENLLKDLLRAACDVSFLKGKTLQQKIKLLLNLRLKNEMIINQLLNVGIIHDGISVNDAAQINNKSKDSLSDLIKTHQILGGLPTENINIGLKELVESLNRKKDTNRPAVERFSSN